MEIIRYKCPHCQAINKLVKYWKQGEDAPDNEFTCHYCNGKISVKNDAEKVAQDTPVLVAAGYSANAE